MLISAVNKAQLNQSILIVDTMSYMDIAKRRVRNTVNFLDRFEAFNKDMLLVIINTNVVLGGSHWMLGPLGVVIFAEKAVIIIDSLEGVDPENRKESAMNLHIEIYIAMRIHKNTPPTILGIYTVAHN